MLNKLLLIVLVVLFFLLGGCKQGSDLNDTLNSDIPEYGQLDYTTAEIEQMLDEIFRIDIKTIDVIFDYYPEPENSYIECQAKVVFVMRMGQTRPLIHLNPAVESKESVSGIILDGEALDIFNEADVQSLGFENTQQDALEFQRDLEANQEHTLEMTYRLNSHGNHPSWNWSFSDNYPWFLTYAIDLDGRGNEDVFPTINSPAELARHRLVFRIHSETDYTCLGSGKVQENLSANVQEWILDTELEVASYTVMFVVLPEEDVVYTEQNIAGIDVRVMAFIDDLSIDDAISLLEPWLPELIDRLGPFPMPQGLSIFLLRGGGGMEYFGGTLTSLTALRHEVFHMYYGCSTVNKTYRDSWLDEAINMWYEYSVNPNYPSIKESFRSNIVSRFSPIEGGFDIRAYNEGARIIQAVAKELGGRNQMIAFLRYLCSNYSFSPYTTTDFLDYLWNYSGIDMKQQFYNWLYIDGVSSTPDAASTYLSIKKHKPIIKPPESILKKYRNRE